MSRLGFSITGIHNCRYCAFKLNPTLESPINASVFERVFGKEKGW